MFFVFRMLFWIAVVALLLPASPDTSHQSAANTATVGSLTERAISAAASFCAGNAEKCAAGLDGARRLGDLLASKSMTAGTIPVQHLVALPPPRPAIP